MNINGCRVSEEDARDSHFDGTMREAVVNIDRDLFAAMMLEMNLMAERLFSDKNFEPDEDDFVALDNLTIQLKYYERLKNL